MRQTPKNKKNRIVKRYFLAETYRAIAAREDCAISTVNTVINEFIGFASDNSLDKAAKKYDVREEIEILRDIAYESEKANLSLHQLLGGSRLLQLMKKLDLEPLQLEDTINIFEKHKEKFGDFIESAQKLGNLEAETGKSYSQVITEYEKTKEKLNDLTREIKRAEVELCRKQEDIKRKIEGLNREIKAKETEVDELERRAKTAQTKIADFNKTQNEIRNYGLSFNNYEIVKDFLSEISRLEGNAVQAVTILKECGSLHKKLEQLKADNAKHITEHQKEELIFKITIKSLQDQKTNLEGEITELKEVMRSLQSKYEELVKTIDKRKEYRQALENQVDGLLRTQAEMLQVMPDIDEVHQALPKKKKELSDTNQKIEAIKPVLSIGAALENLLQKKPLDRNAIILWLRSGRIFKSYQPTDEQSRQKIMQLLAQEGYILRIELEKAQADMKRKIDAAEEQTKFWVKRAERKSKELIECQDLLQEVTGGLDKQRNDKLIKKVSSFLVSLSEKI